MNSPRPPRAFTSVALMLVLMFAGSLGLWVAMPLGWFWVGGRVQAATGSLGAAVGVVLLGVVVSVVLFMPLLSWLAHRHAAARERRGLEDMGWAPLEGVLVVSAVIALVVFCTWFFVFAGAEPLPMGEPK